LIFGKSGGFPPTIDLDTLSAADGVIINNAGTTRVAGVGDVNGDGFADFAIRLGSNASIVFGRSSFPAQLV
jgi:hypothetical protein